MGNKVQFTLETFGTFVLTRGVSETMKTNEEFANAVAQALHTKYIHCNWGCLDKEDKKLNDDALSLGLVPKGEGRIFAKYHTNGKGDDDLECYENYIYIISNLEMIDEKTQGVVTTILFPDEY